jgi:hypothetical protein
MMKLKLKNLNKFLKIKKIKKILKSKLDQIKARNILMDINIVKIC